MANSGYTLFCDGTRWVNLIRYHSTGDHYFASAGAVALPDGTTAQRPAPSPTSDRRLKKDIENLAAGQLEKLIRLQGVSFKMLSDPDGRTELGLIAQDVQAVYPELVQEGGSGTLSLNYSGLIAPMIEAIKEQQAEIDELKNAALVARIEALESRL